MALNNIGNMMKIMNAWNISGPTIQVKKRFSSTKKNINVR